MKNLFVLYTGGTIGMRQSTTGLIPDAQLAQTVSEQFGHRCHLHWHLCDPLIDSADINAQHWHTWRNLIANQLPQHDGILILHGTDTLAYTANDLALHFNHHRRPIIITGAMQPYGTVGSDAERNLQTAIEALLTQRIQETVIAFNGQLHRAIGSSKCSTEQHQAIVNHHFGQWQAEQPTPQLPKPPQIPSHTPTVCCHLLAPISNAALIAHNLTHYPQQAAILLSYGNGNAPNDPALQHAIRQFTQSGRLLLNISQVPHGQADDSYAQSSGLRHNGAVMGGRCNLETAVPLMHIAAAENWSRADLEQALSALKLK